MHWALLITRNREVTILHDYFDLQEDHIVGEAALKLFD